MQQFLLFCTMLIVASEVFSKELHGSRISKRIKRRTSRFARDLFPSSPDRYMFRRFNVPMFSAPPLYESPDYQQPPFFPVSRLYDVRPKRNRYQFLPQTKRFTNRKRSRRKSLRKTRWSPIPPPYFADFVAFNAAVQPNFWPSGLVPDFRNFSDFYRDGVDFITRNPNQYIVCFYPVFIRPRKRALEGLKNRRYLNLKRQYLTNVRNKNKRSASNATKEVPSEEKKQKSDEGAKQNDKNVESSMERPYFGFLPDKRGSADEKFSNEGTNSKNLDAQNLNHASVYNNRYESLMKGSDYLSNPYLYNPYLEVTQPPVTLPTITFKYPYDPKVYDSSLRSEFRIPSKFFKKEISENVPEDTPKVNTEECSHPNIVKLRKMLQEVQSVLKSDIDDIAIPSCEEETKKEKHTENGAGTENTTQTTSLKQKIDSVVPILLQISEELGKLINATSYQGGVHKQKSKAASRCSADGTWTSSALGLEMAFTTMPNMMLNVKVTSNDNTLINKKWSMQGLTLSKHGGPIMLAAIYPQRRKIASFIGQCKMCEDQDLIFGSWTIYSCVRRFTDLWSAVETKLDILRKKRIGIQETKTDSNKKSQKFGIKRWCKRKSGNKKNSTISFSRKPDKYCT